MSEGHADRGQLAAIARLAAARDRLRQLRAWSWCEHRWSASIGGAGWRRMREQDLDTHALALCAQQVLCTAPLIVALSALMQWTTGRNISVVVGHFFGLGPEATRDIGELFGRTTHTGALTVIGGLAVAVVFMTSVGAVQQRGFETIWRLPRVTGVRAYLRQLVFAVALAGFTVAILLATRLGHLLDARVIGIGAWVVVLAQAAITFAFYWWTQYWLLGGRIAVRELLPGAAAVGVLTLVLVRVSRVVMSGQIASQVRSYGLIGAVFVLSIWLMILSGVILGGVLFGALLSERRAARTVSPAELPVPPEPAVLRGPR